MKARLDLDRFDRVVLAVIVLLIAGIILLVLIGNNIGVQVESYAPEGLAGSDTTIHVRFFNEMAEDTVEERFHVEPESKGRIRWNGKRELIFEPEMPLTGGAIYTVVVKEGAKSENGSAILKDDLTFNFQVALPRILYLAPADARDRNLYLNDLNNSNIFNLTESTNGLVDYAVSPAGDAIAFTEYKDDGTSDIWLYHPASGSINQITDCVNASCGMPVWKPDGTQISYEREEYDPVFQQIGARRIWTVDLTSMQSTVLFEDTQITGHSATYSPSGNKIAMFATNPPGILIYDFVGQNQLFIDSMQGIVGEFSEDGTKIIYPILTRGAAGQQFYTQLEMVDFTKNQRVRVTASDQPIDDSTGVWRPGHVNQLAVSRRYLDTRYTDGYQVYLLDIDSGEATPLVVDGDYNQGALNWSPDGNLLVMQRFDRTEPGSRPQIWVYNMQTQELQLIAENAYLPGFLP